MEYTETKEKCLKIFKRETERLNGSIKKVMSTPEGRLVYVSLLYLTGYLNDRVQPQNAEYTCGRLDVGFQIYKLIKDASPEDHNLAIMEYDENRKKTLKDIEEARNSSMNIVHPFDSSEVENGA